MRQPQGTVGGPWAKVGVLSASGHCHLAQGNGWPLGAGMEGEPTGSREDESRCVGSGHRGWMHRVPCRRPGRMQRALSSI